MWLFTRGYRFFQAFHGANGRPMAGILEVEMSRAEHQQRSDEAMKWWLVGDWNMTGLFSHILGTGNNHPNWLIFFRGVAQPPTRCFLMLFRLFRFLSFRGLQSLLEAHVFFNLKHEKIGCWLTEFLAAWVGEYPFMSQYSRYICLYIVLCILRLRLNEEFSRPEWKPNTIATLLTKAWEQLAPVADRI